MNIHNFIEKTFNPNSIFFEIGSHFGTDTERLSKVTSNIHCFDPDPRNTKIFSKLELPVILNEFAISNHDGKSKFNLSSGNVYDSKFGPTDNDRVNKEDWSASSSLKDPKEHLVKVPWVKFNSSIEVKTRRIDSYCFDNRISKIDFIWMDVQGAEDLVIEGMGEMKEKIRFIYTEYETGEELYKGSPTLEKIMNLLGEEWEILKKYDNDVLVYNKNL